MTTAYSRGSGNAQKDLNHMSPAANVARLGDRVNDLTNTVNLLTAQNNALLAALTAATGAVIPSLVAVNALVAPKALIVLGLPYGPPEIPGDRP